MYSVCVEHWPAFHITYFLLFTASWAIRAIPCPVTDADRVAPPGVGGAEKHGGPWLRDALANGGADLVPRCAKCQATRRAQISLMWCINRRVLGDVPFSCHIVVHVFSWQARFWTRKEKTTEHSRPRPRPKPEMEAPSSNFGKKQPVRCVQVPLEAWM